MVRARRARLVAGDNFSLAAARARSHDLRRGARRTERGTIFRVCSRPRPRIVLATIATIGLLAAPGCGDDDDGGSASPEEYCEIVAELDAAGGEAFSSLSEDATEAEYDEVQQQFVEDNRERFEDLVDAAPETIRADVRSVVNGVLTGSDAPDNEAASDRVSEFDAETCGSDGSGES